VSVSWLLDVNFILASRWATHPDHQAAEAWLHSVAQFYTCAISELGFVRISLSSAYGATWNDIQESLKDLHARRSYRFIADDVNGTHAPKSAAKDTTDAHLVARAKRHGLKLATLDMALTGKSWAAGIAENPLRSSLKSS
jgi:predicted nucleic acid-binding protein